MVVPHPDVAESVEGSLAAKNGEVINTQEECEKNGHSSCDCSDEPEKGVVVNRTRKDTVREEDVKHNLKKIKGEIQELQHAMVSSLNQKLTEMLDHFVAEVEEAELPGRLKTFNVNTHEKKRKKSPSGSLPEKEFCHRNSLLTDLLEINHIQTIYHIFAAILVVLLLNTVVYDILEKGMVDYDFKLIQYSFGQPKTVLFIWTGMMFTTSVFVYTAFHMWAHKRGTITNSMQLKLWDGLALTLFIVYLCLFFVVPVLEIANHNLPPASSVIILDEQVRFLMKTYAFVRSNAPTAIRHSNIVRRGGRREELKALARQEEIDGPCPDFGKYLYFLFAPTLIYRHHYPRTQSTSWRAVFGYFAQVIGMVFYMYFIFNRFCIPVFRKFGQEAFTLKSVILSVFGCMMPGTLVLVITFYCVLHVWMNGFAEMLRFGDRMFYKDWWNSSSYARFYRTWNIVVHDWLYTYVYKDIYEFTGRKNRLLPKIMVFAISSIVHEYIMGFTMRFFFPIIFLLFGVFGVAFAFLTNMGVRVGNVFLWATLFIGTGLLMSLYSMEFYAQINCPSAEGYMKWLPRSWTCEAVLLQS